MDKVSYVLEEKEVLRINEFQSTIKMDKVSYMKFSDMSVTQRKKVSIHNKNGQGFLPS